MVRCARTYPTFSIRKKSHSPQVLPQVNSLPEICKPSEGKTIPIDLTNSKYLPRTKLGYGEPSSETFLCLFWLGQVSNKLNIRIYASDFQVRAKTSSESFPGGIFPVRVRLGQVIIVDKSDFSEYGAICHIRMRTNMAHAPYSHDIRSQLLYCTYNKQNYQFTFAANVTISDFCGAFLCRKSHS